MASFLSASLERRLPGFMRGFTLVELAIVLLIVSLLVGGVMMAVSTQQEIQRIKDTEKKLDEIREALIGYALANNGALPCPSQSATSGSESRSGGTTCNGSNPLSNVYVGFLPWETLGVSQTDAWGHLFRYSVTKTFADKPSTYDFNAVGRITVDNDSMAQGALISDAVAVVLSHGARAAYAYTMDGQQVPDDPGVLNTDEDTNGTQGDSFVSRPPAAPGAPAPGAFDDIVVWLPSTILKARLAAAGILPR